MRGRWLVVLAAVPLLAACGSNLADGIAACPRSDGVSLSGTGESVTVLVGYVPRKVADCVLDATGVPENVRAQIDQTRLIDGVQSATWDGYAATWSVNSLGTAELVVSRQ